MNRKEWYESYSAARMLIRSRFPRGMIGTHSDNRGSTLVWDITYALIGDMGHGIRQAVFAGNDCFYPIKENRWAVKRNHKCLNLLR